MDDKNYIVQMIIKKTEKSTVDWKDGYVRKHQIMVQQNDLGKRNERKQQIVQELLELQKKGLLVKIEWCNRESDPEYFIYSLKDRDKFYEIAGIVPKAVRKKKYEEWLEKKVVGARKPWVRAFYQDLSDQTKNVKEKFPGYIEKEYSPVYESENRELFLCIDALDTLKSPVYKRVFSKKYLRNSKRFEKEYQEKIVSIVQKYGKEEEGIISGASEAEILPQILLEEYHVSMSVKGTLKVNLDGKEIDYAVFPYGCEINTETLKKLKLLPEQTIRKIIVIENKANFISMPYEKDTLLIFSHGYFSPLERKVLQELCKILNNNMEKVEYFHTGDLDYGGIQIFRYIKRHIFCELQPLNMDKQTYERYLIYGESVDEEKEKTYWEKLEKIEEEIFRELIQKMLEEKKIIEQEAFLAEKI